MSKTCELTCLDCLNNFFKPAEEIRKRDSCYFCKSTNIAKFYGI